MSRSFLEVEKGQSRQRAAQAKSQRMERAEEKGGNPREPQVLETTPS